MFLIGICDDNAEEREYLKQMCERCFDEMGYSCECRCFSSGEEAVSYSGQRLHLLFLDVEMGELDGLQVCRALEDTDRVWRVVFVSSHREAVFGSFGLKTLDFGVKPVSYEQMCRWISVMIRENKENTILHFAAPEGERLLELEQIYCMEAAGNYIYICTEAEKFLAAGNLKLWEEKCRRSVLVRVHKSYLVNLLWVKEFPGDVMILKNGKQIPIGRKYKADAKEKYRQTIYARMRGRI